LLIGAQSNSTGLRDINSHHRVAQEESKLHCDQLDSTSGWDRDTVQK
jgi:hypothetical protein